MCTCASVRPLQSAGGRAHRPEGGEREGQVECEREATPNTQFF